MSIKIGVCEDSRVEKDIILKLLQKYFEDKQIDMQIECFESGKCYMEALKGESEPDILLLDIEMPEVNGIQLKEYLQEKRSKTKILFITSHLEAVWEAFGENVYGFIKKPIIDEKFFEYMNKIYKALEYEKPSHYIDEETGEKIALSDVLWIKSEGQYSRVRMENEDRFSKLSIAEWEGKLEGDIFWRVHRSFIVNFRHVAKILDDVKLNNGVCIPIARRRKAIVKEAYKEFLIREVQ